jgi:hypothetical protein
MINNSGLIGIVVAAAVAFLVTGSVIPMVLAQGGNVTAGGGDLLKKLGEASVKAKALKAVINNKDIFVVACDPGFTDPATQCQVYTTQPAGQ